MNTRQYNRHQYGMGEDMDEETSPPSSGHTFESLRAKHSSASPPRTSDNQHTNTADKSTGAASSPSTQTGSTPAQGGAAASETHSPGGQTGGPPQGDEHFVGANGE